MKIPHIEPTKFLQQGGVQIRILDEDFTEENRAGGIMTFHPRTAQLLAIKKGIENTIEADFRYKIFNTAKEAELIKESNFKKSDCSHRPLRFNRKFDFIEPYIRKHKDREEPNWWVNPEWESAQYQLSVFPKNERKYWYGIIKPKTDNDLIQIFVPKFSGGVESFYAVEFFKR